jgi:chloramphenicol 3-O-phosphotransferase
MPDPHPSRARFLDRNHEREMLDRLVEETRASRSRVLVLRGEAGIGKTALLEYLSDVAAGCRIARVAGVESEMELAFATVPARHHPALTQPSGCLP